MKLFALACALFMLAIPASAQSPWSFGVHGNITNVDVGNDKITAIQINSGEIAGIGGNIQEVFGLGVGGGLHLDLSLGPLALRLQGDYITLSPDNGKFQAAVAQAIGSPSFASRFSVSGGRIDLYSGTLNLKLTILPVPVFKPYVTGGAGLASISTTEAKISMDGNPVYTVEPIKSQTKTALNAGAGLDLAFGGVTLYAEVRLNFVLTDPKTTAQVPVGTVGLTF